MQVGQAILWVEYLASLHTRLQCRQPYKPRSVKNKAATDGGKRRALTAASVAQDKDEVFVTGSTIKSFNCITLDHWLESGSIFLPRDAMHTLRQLCRHAVSVYTER